MPPSPPSLQPPMNWPLTNTCGTLVLPVNALSSAFWESVTSTSLNYIMMHCMAAAHIGFACAADKWMSIDGQLIIYTRVTRAILCVV